MTEHTTDELVDAINRLAEDQRQIGAMVFASTLILRALLETEAERNKGATGIRITDIRDRSRKLARLGMADSPLAMSQTALALDQLWETVLPQKGTDADTDPGAPSDR